MTRIPALYRQLVKDVRTYADQQGDTHAGWAAIADLWETEDLARAFARARARTVQEALAVAGQIANDIVRNTRGAR